MHAGVHFFPSALLISPVDFALAAEDRGFESVFFPDHTHISVGTESPEYYRTVLDTLVALDAVAPATRTIRIGTAVCLVPQRDPIILAMQIATVDQLSGGRVLFGVGAGSNADELRNHGTDPDRRFAVLRERIAAMMAIWTQDEAAYDGEYVRFDPLWSWPKPVQRPRPPVLLGGTGPRILERVVEYADGWMPYRDGTDQVADDLTGEIEDFERGLERRIRELMERDASAGRPTIPVTLFNACPHPRALARYAGLGIERVVFWLRTQDKATPLHTLDRLAELVASQ